MKNWRMTIWLVAVAVVIITGRMQAATHFNDGGKHDINYFINDSVHVDEGAAYAEMRTTVNLLEGGEIWNMYLRAYNRSRVNISGGTAYNLSAYDTSTVSISSTGRVSRTIYAYDNSEIDLSGGSVYSLIANNSSMVNIFGSSIGAIIAWDNSTINFSSGSVIDVRAFNATANISGGRIGYLRSLGTSTVDISGGFIGGILAGDRWATSFATIRIIGKYFEWSDGLSLTGNELVGTGMLSGQWLDGTEWTTEIVRNDETATILLIPEPATMLLLGLGGLLLRKRK